MPPAMINQSSWQIFRLAVFLPVKSQWKEYEGSVCNEITAIWFSDNLPIKGGLLLYFNGIYTIQNTWSNLETTKLRILWWFSDSPQKGPIMQKVFSASNQWKSLRVIVIEPAITRSFFLDWLKPECVFSFYNAPQVYRNFTVSDVGWVATDKKIVKISISTYTAVLYWAML